MKLNDLIQELKESSAYKEFTSKNPQSYLCAGFFILDLKHSKKDQIQFDFFLPDQNKIAAFEYPFDKSKVFDDIVPQIKPLDTNIKIDLDQLDDKCAQILKDNKTSLVPSKIISILKEDVWTLTCMDDMLGMSTIKLNSKTEELISFKKGSLMDFMGVKKK